jgi:hypothetical protein
MILTLVVKKILKNLEQCEEDEGKFICQQCDSIFCEKCFEVLHRSEKKKLHEKKEIQENFVSQKCPKHENKKLDLFCLKDEEKCCSLCLDDHQSHEVISISKACELFKSEIQNKNFKEIYSELERNNEKKERIIRFRISKTTKN